MQFASGVTGSEPRSWSSSPGVLVAILGGILYWLYTVAGWPVRGLPAHHPDGLLHTAIGRVCQIGHAGGSCTQDILDSRIEQEATMRDFRNKCG